MSFGNNRKNNENIHENGGQRRESRVDQWLFTNNVSSTVCSTRVRTHELLLIVLESCGTGPPLGK